MNTEPKIAIISFYSFINIENPNILLSKLLYYGKRKNIKGTILIAPEGINGSISGKKESLIFLIEEAIKLTSATEVNIKLNYSSFLPFNKFKVKLKPEIINMGIPIHNIDAFKGEYIDTFAWDKFISSEDVIVIDTRNEYEIELGTFKNSLNPKTKTFKELPKWLEENKELLRGKKIAMYCTGGIRCEKSTAYLKMQGFDQVYHLKGGILQYLEDTNNLNGAWGGDCFVFDARIGVDQDLSPSENK